MHSLLVWFLLWGQHALRVAGAAFFMLTFVVFFTRSGTQWFHIALGALVGLCFGLVFVFGTLWADIEERGSEVRR